MLLKYCRLGSHLLIFLRVFHSGFHADWLASAFGDSDELLSSALSTYAISFKPERKSLLPSA